MMPSKCSTDPVSKRARNTAGILFLCLLFLPSLGRTGGPGIIGIIETGFDSFNEKYSIVEEDSLDDISEFRTKASLGYLAGNRFSDYFRLEGLAVASNNIYEGGGSLGFAASAGKFRFGTEVDGIVRRYQSNSTYAFPNDYERYSMRTYIQKSLTPSVYLRLSDRLERMDFDQTTEFDYDYWKNSIYLSGNLERSLDTFINAGIGYTIKSIPDTTEIAYKAFTSHLDIRRYLGLYKRLALSIHGERRIYAHEPARSPFWAISADFSLVPFSHESIAFAADNSLESYIYDSNSGVYFSYAENKTALLMIIHRLSNLQIQIGPTYAFFSSNFSEEDRYQEIGGRFVLEYFKGAKIWLSLSYEPGRRFYRAYDDNASESIFSDYTFNRLIIFATGNLWDGISINGFLNFEPEDHKREGDDSTITLVSLSLTYSF